MKRLSPGRYRIQPSQNSGVLSLIKPHKRPKKVILPCKCHFTINHECDQGFSHKRSYYCPTGEHNSASGFSTESSIHQGPMVPEVWASIPYEGPDQIQPQPPAILEYSQVLDRFDDHWLTQDIDWRSFLESLETPTPVGYRKEGNDLY
uniref:Pathogenicity associated protein n=1 Tax=Beet curly top virus TaxID=10840 RepID=A0A125RA02_9GEMI|nr:pathogenicity associated protein [Beet curly top virus]